MITICILTCVAIVLIGYHHVGYPVLLKYLPAARRHPQTSAHAMPAQPLPHIEVIMPAYNEAAYIADKIRNLAMVDYPTTHFRVTLLCDGCSDNTARIARDTLAEPECAHLPLQIHEYADNQGKVARLNQAIQSSQADLIALSDISALISIDALHILRRQFQDQHVGVVTGSYQLLSAFSEGEACYWRYQSELKQRESAMGSTIGVHGAFYAFRAALHQPLPADTINDDFVLPMLIVSQGYRAVYAADIHALELEQSNSHIEQKRRIRIAAGNLQQLVRLVSLLSPKHRWTAFNFMSGKGLRTVMPWLLLQALLGSLSLTLWHSGFLLLLLPQLLIYLIALGYHYGPRQYCPALFKTIHYIVHGYWLCAVGELRYLSGLERGRWQRANQTGAKS